MAHLAGAFKVVSMERILVESGAAAAVSFVAITMSTEEVAVGVTITTGLIGVVVWLMRLQGTVQMQGMLLRRIEERLNAGDGKAEVADILAAIDANLDRRFEELGESLQRPARRAINLDPQ